MKLPTFLNLATFFVTATAITYAVSGIAVSERHDVQAVFDRLNEIRSGRESLIHDTLNFVQSQSPDQDRLAENCERLQAKVAELVNHLDTLAPSHRELHSSVVKAIDAAAQTTNRVDRIRAQYAVLCNVESTLPKLVESLIELLPENSAHWPDLKEFASTFPVLARSQHAQAEQSILKAKSNLERLRSLHGDDKWQRLLDLATAQIDRVLAYRHFQQTELQLLIDGRQNRVFSDCLKLAKDSVDRFVIHSHGLVRILMIASVSLIAFCCAGVWQYRGQAMRLSQLNDVLEDRVSERTRAVAEAKRQSEAQLDALDRIQIRAEFDTSGFIIRVNDNFLFAMGYSAEDVIGQHHQMFVFPDDLSSDEYAQFWSKLRAGEYLVGEYRRRAKDGTERWIHATYSPVVDENGNIEKVVKYATDITKQRSIEEKAQRRIRDLANVILESPNEVFICDAHTLQFIEVNQGAVDASGYSAEELRCMTPLDLNPEFEKASIDKLLEELLNGRKHTLEFQSQHRRKTGETYPVQISLHLSSYNEIPAFVAFVTDMTSMKQLERKLALARKLESVGQLAAGVAHEINTPLQCISGNIEYLSTYSGRIFDVLDFYQSLLENEATPLSWEARCQKMQELLDSCRFASLRKQMPAAIEESREAVHRTVKIVRAMRDFSHPGTKSMQPANLNDLIESSIAISRSRWKLVAEVELKLHSNLPAIPMFASEMNQVLLNLIVNAGDAIADRFPMNSGITGTISITTDFDESWVYLTVADTGCGIPEGIRDKLFDPFFTTKEVGKGTGQGLSLAYGVVVHEHHGYLELESEVGVGSQFIVKLPRSQSEADSAMQLASHGTQ